MKKIPQLVLSLSLAFTFTLSSFTPTTFAYDRLNPELTTKYGFSADKNDENIVESKNNDKTDEIESIEEVRGRVLTFIISAGAIIYKGVKTYFKASESYVENAIAERYGEGLNRYSDLREIELENGHYIYLEHGTSSWGMEHILSKHHPEYNYLDWTGTNTMFEPGTTFEDIENMIITVASYGDNDKKIKEVDGDKITVYGKYKDKKYVMVVDGNGVTTLYPDGWNYAGKQ